MKIKLLTIEGVKLFNKLAINFDGEVMLKSGRYTIDAKSILGIFSLDLTKPVELEIECDSKEKEEEFIRDLIGLKMICEE